MSARCLCGAVDPTPSHDCARDPRAGRGIRTIAYPRVNATRLPDIGLGATIARSLRESA